MIMHQQSNISRSLCVRVYARWAEPALSGRILPPRESNAGSLKIFLILGLLVLPGAVLVSAQSSPDKSDQGPQLNIVVTDENNVAVPSARVTVEGPGGPIHCETDRAGRCDLPELAGGPWQLRVEKETFYVFSLSDVQTSGTLSVEIRHEQEVRETVNVVASSPAIDPEQISSRERLTGLDVINIPYPNTRDYRYVLNYLPGVVLDPSAQPHLAGGETYQALTLLDGFNVTQPANGQLLARVSTDAIRNVNVETTRIPAEYGKGPAGILALNTGIGDDHFRFAATNFVPSLQNKKGWTLDKVDPRFTFSGPIKRGKVWFFDGIDGEYDNVVIPDLPNGEDTNHVWRLGNLAKVQANLASRDIVTTSILVNRLHDDHQAFSTLAPATTRPIDNEDLYFVSAKDQHSISAESLLEVGIAFSQYDQRQQPDGNAPYVLTPETAMGNYYLRSNTTARRSQAMANFYTPEHWHGRHDLMAGIDVDRLSYDQLFSRSPISSLREGQSLPANSDCLQVPSPCAYYSVFANTPRSTLYNTETSAYFQDRWAPHSRLLIEPGIRLDWDETIRRPLFSPRLAGTYVLTNSGKSKLSAGVGVTYASTSLSLIAAPLGGSRQNYFFDANGILVNSYATGFSVNRNTLLAPRFLNWSVAFEQELPWRVFVKAEFMQRNGIHDFVYNTTGMSTSNDFILQNTRKDRFHSFRLDFRRTFGARYVITASYARSSSRSNQVLDYSLDSLGSSLQVPGPFSWDTPNRFISWGWFPLIKGFDAGYSTEVRSGFPFGAVNDQQQIVHPPGTYRFPTYITLNFHLEKRFRALGANWALRGGFDNITNRQNPYSVNNNVNSPQFLTFSNFDRRAFTARIRFLGRK
jgi:hypothetical protein